MPAKDGRLSALIIGGGVSGLTAARCLKVVGYDVKVAERLSKPNWLHYSKYAFGIWPNGLKALNAMGLSEVQRERIGLTAPFITYRNQQGESFLNLSKGLQNAFSKPSALENSFFIADASKYLQALQQGNSSASEDEIEILYEKELRYLDGYGNTGLLRTDGSMKDAKVRADFTDETALTADVIIAADGESSSVRSLVASASRRGTYEFSGFRSVCGCYSNDQLDIVDELVGFAPFESISNDGLRFILYPLKPSGRVFWRAVFPQSTPLEGGGGGGALSKSTAGPLTEELRSWLMKSYEGFHAPIPKILSLYASEDSSDLYTISTHHFEDEASYLAHGRIAFVGDAAHTFPPSLEQGASTAIEDAWQLALNLSTLNDEGLKKSLIQTHQNLKAANSVWRRFSQTQTTFSLSVQKSINSYAKIRKKCMEDLMFRSKLATVLFSPNRAFLRNQILRNLPSSLNDMIYRYAFLKS